MLNLTFTSQSRPKPRRRWPRWHKPSPPCLAWLQPSRSAGARRGATAPAPWGGARGQAWQEYFEGKRERFDASRGACLDQFRQDVREGDAASAAGDLQALRRVAHSLKSVLLTLGYPHMSAQARALEARELLVDKRA